MTQWEAVHIVRGRPRAGTIGTLSGYHKTVAGRENFIRSHGKPGLTYAVALKWPTGSGWVAAEPVTVPQPVSTTRRKTAEKKEA